MHYKEYTERAYEIACRHGFHDKELPLAHWLMLVITEVSEMVEADRKGKRAQVAMFKRESVSPQPKDRVKAHWQFCFEQFIKDTVEDEMADVCIRLFDLAGTKGFTPEEKKSGLLLGRYDDYVRSRSFTENAYELCGVLAMSNNARATVEYSLAYLQCWARSLNIDLEWHINQKMEYNDMRSRLHGKKY